MNVKGLIFTVFLLGIHLAGICQISDFVQYQSFEWNYWEIYGNDEEKSEFLNSFGLSSLSPSAVRIIDINGDQIPDVISIPQPDKVVLMIGDGASFETVLDLNETLLMIGRPKPWNPIYLLTRDDNCCEPGYYSLNYHRPGFDDSEGLTYLLDKSIIVWKDVELITENLPPFRFELKSDQSLKSKADSGSSEIGKYTTGSSGFAVASAKGADGGIWWLVLMPVGEKALMAGWMPSNELKRKF